jgi:3-methyl-2-oxobutanoate hydroxymethyltransferase
LKAKLTVPALRTAKQEGRKLTMVTAYDYTSAVIADRSPVDMMLVGDSLGMVMLGYSGTTQVTMEEMLHHIRPVVRGASGTFVVGDMPFGSYNVNAEQAVRSANRLVKAGVDCVKLEGGVQFFDTVRALVRGGIPVMGHVGLTPQTAPALGGWKVQGKDAEAARQIIDDALALEQAGACSVVLEMVPAPLAAHITARLSIPTIGIGAGSQCDGQVLVWHDMMGLYDKLQPRFVKQYADLSRVLAGALEQYCSDVLSGAFPGPEHSFKMKPEELAAATGERLPSR